MDQRPPPPPPPPPPPVSLATALHTVLLLCFHTTHDNISDKSFILQVKRNHARIRISEIKITYIS